MGRIGFGFPISSLNKIKEAIKFEGLENIYSPGTPFLLLAPPGNGDQLASLEEWQEFWPLGDKDSQLCEMDLNRRIRINLQRGNSNQVDIRPSAKAAQDFPKRGIDPETAGIGEKYHQFRKTAAYQTWIIRATEDWPDLSEKK